MLLLCVCFNRGFAQADRINVVTTAVPFLRISPDAKAGGMGDVGIATTPDANASFWNLAKTPFAKSKTSISATYTPWLRDLGLNDVYLAALAGYYQLDEQQAVALSTRYFSLGNIQFTDFAGNDLGSFRPREFSVDFGYSRKLSSKLGLGVALRYINSNLAGGQSANGVTYKAGNAVAGDVSLFHNGVSEANGGWAWGLVLSNLGSKIAYTNDVNNKDYIPANLGAGISYTTVFDEINKIQFAVDINKLLVPTPPLPSDPSDPTQDSIKLAEYRSYGVMQSWFKSFSDGGNELKELMIGVGAEYSYNDQFMFRAGYFYEDKTKGNRKYFTLGAGLRYNVFGFNFSYLIPSGNGVNRNPLSNTLRFSLIFDLDKENTGTK
ncbi:MAG TPA: type IX secretion system outer membrane channel protein PorV [Chitinophagaceae bacterium]